MGGNAEDLDLGALVADVGRMRFAERIAHAGPPLRALIGGPTSNYLRCLTSPNEREVRILDGETGDTRTMVMFASNSYLALTNHPKVRERVEAAMRDYGVGMAASAIVCGYSKLHAELEERLSALKHAEATMLFPTGYQANVGACAGLMQPQDVVLYDEYSHTSFCDGLEMAGVKGFKFLHNDVDDLESLLEDEGGRPGRDVFVGVEGVYSMDGDAAPLDRIVPACKRAGAILIVDDAHGTCVLGETGAGTAEYHGVPADVDVAVTTFSKALGMVGGAISGSRDIIGYLRYFANSYVFSTSLPPIVVAAVMGGLDVLEQEPERRARLHDNVRYTRERLAAIGIEVDVPAAIVPIRVPRGMNIQRAARRFHRAGLFVGVIEYPAVPLQQQRFRASIMSSHTREDIDRLVACVEEVWAAHAAGEL